MSLADRVRAAREQWVSAGGREWLIRRPTDLRVAQLSGGPMAQLVMESVVGWKLPENELVPGGGGETPAFDSEAFREWVGDRTDILVQLSKHIEAILDQHQQKQKVSEKN